MVLAFPQPPSRLRRYGGASFRKSAALVTKLGVNIFDWLYRDEVRMNYVQNFCNSCTVFDVVAGVRGRDRRCAGTPRVKVAER